MNTLNYIAKYVEYNLKVARYFLINDTRFHTQRLRTLLNREPNLIHPVTLNEKMCYRLIYDRNPLYTQLADKLAVREYVLSRTDELMIAPLINTYKNTRDIDFNTLPNSFVIKCNHDSGSTIICKDKGTFNTQAALLTLDLAMKKNMYYCTREWQYKDIVPTLLCEEYIELFEGRDRGTTPEMLRIHCFAGCASFIEADFTDEQGREYVNVYNRKWELQPFQIEYPNHPASIPEPALFYRALSTAQALAKDIDYCRVDIMLKDDSLYFSEITLTPQRGKLKILPQEWDAKLGAMWQQQAYHKTHRFPSSPAVDLR
ncbi:ATP-grasp fold amidoligase family protein [Pantoea allii]|uniref:ATP-grasp fold amidoligase family protein n=1 Tax=Pantoea allii TaxID=574096 RepID=UPI001560C325|nr:ATP-grasp fold amidoligase family protein [Pantoea allii]NQS85407.1 glycosyl transferase [Pantoea allii]